MSMYTTNENWNTGEDFAISTNNRLALCQITKLHHKNEEIRRKCVACLRPI